MTPPPHHGPDGRFANPWPGASPQPFSALLRWWRERRAAGRPADPPRGSFAVAKPSIELARRPDELALTWIGHSAALLEIADRRVLFDPMLGEFAAPFPVSSLRRWVPPTPSLGQLPPVDLICLSHNHYDHLDRGSVRQLAARWPDVPWLAPLGLAALLRRLGVRRVEELDWWDRIEMAGLEIGATPAQHFSARTPWDRNRSLWCGFVVGAADRRVYFAGDTGYHPEFGAIGQRWGPFDLAMFPIGAYEPRWFMRAVHLDPTEAIEAYRALDPGGRAVFVAIHWGTFKLTDEPLDEPPRRLGREWLEAGLPTDRLWIPTHGETRVMSGDRR